MPLGWGQAGICTPLTEPRKRALKAILFLSLSGSLLLAHVLGPSVLLQIST